MHGGFSRLHRPYDQVTVVVMMKINKNKVRVDHSIGVFQAFQVTMKEHMSIQSYDTQGKGMEWNKME